jgi:hypothetical protein
MSFLLLFYIYIYIYMPSRKSGVGDKVLGVKTSKKKVKKQTLRKQGRRRKQIHRGRSEGIKKTKRKYNRRRYNRGRYSKMKYVGGGFVQVGDIVYYNGPNIPNLDLWDQGVVEQVGQPGPGPERSFLINFGNAESGDRKVWLPHYHIIDARVYDWISTDVDPTLNLPELDELPDDAEMALLLHTKKERHKLAELLRRSHAEHDIRDAGKRQRWTRGSHQAWLQHMEDKRRMSPSDPDNPDNLGISLLTEGIRRSMEARQPRPATHPPPPYHPSPSSYWSPSTGWVVSKRARVDGPVWKEGVTQVRQIPAGRSGAPETRPPPYWTSPTGYVIREQQRREESGPEPEPE